MCIEEQIKIDFKENHTYRNRHCQIFALSGLKIHSKWGYAKPNSDFSFNHRVVRIVLKRNLSSGALNWVIPVGIEPLSP